MSLDYAHKSNQCKEFCRFCLTLTKKTTKARILFSLGDERGDSSVSLPDFTAMQRYKHSMECEVSCMPLDA